MDQELYGVLTPNMNTIRKKMNKIMNNTKVFKSFIRKISFILLKIPVVLANFFDSTVICDFHLRVASTRIPRYFIDWRCYTTLYRA